MAVAFTQLTVAEVEPTARARVARGAVLGREEGWSLSPLRSHLEPTDQNPLPPASVQSRLPLALGWENARPSSPPRQPPLSGTFLPVLVFTFSTLLKLGPCLSPSCLVPQALWSYRNRSSPLTENPSPFALLVPENCGRVSTDKLNSDENTRFRRPRFGIIPWRSSPSPIYSVNKVKEAHTYAGGSFYTS